MTHIWSVLCSESVVDIASNNVSLFQVLEQIYLQVEKKKDGEELTVPVPFPFEWVTLWARLNKNKPMVGIAKDTILNPAGDVISEKEYKVDLSQYGRTRFRRKVSGLPVKASGQYKFITYIKNEKRNTWKVVSSVPIDITLDTVISAT